METTKKVKAFDSVKMMREVRDRISAETQNMNVEQLRSYIQARLAPRIPPVADKTKKGS